MIPIFKDTVKSDPDDRFAALAYYRALAKDGTGIDEAIAGLRGLVKAHPEDPALAEGMVFALLTDGLLEEAGRVLAGLPASIAKDRRFARYRGQIAEANRDAEAAIREYTIALEDDPSDQAVLHRLSEQYKRAGRDADAEAMKAREARVEAAGSSCGRSRGEEESQLGDRPVRAGAHAALPGRASDARALQEARLGPRADGAPRRGARLVSPGPHGRPRRRRGPRGDRAARGAAIGEAPKRPSEPPSAADSSRIPGPDRPTINP